MAREKKPVYAHPQLGAGLRRTEHYVRGMVTRIITLIHRKNRRIYSPALDMPGMCCYI